MNQSKITRLLAHFIVPVIFSITGYLILFVAFKPYIEMAISVASIFRAGDPGDTKAPAETIYDPNAAPAQVRGGDEDPYIHVNDMELPSTGVQYGRLYCEKIGLDAPVYWDDTYEILRQGAGQYIGSFLPGYGRMILLSAHNNSHFRPLKDMQIGDVIQFDTNYCNYEYEVYHIQVYDETELEQWIRAHLLDEEEVLVMYTCWPFEFQAGRKTKRLTIFAHRISGYDVKWRNVDEIE